VNLVLCPERNQEKSYQVLYSDNLASHSSDGSPSSLLDSFVKERADKAGEKLNWQVTYHYIDILYPISRFSEVLVEGMIIGIATEEYKDIQVIGIGRLKVVVYSIATTYGIVFNDALSFQAIQGL